MSRNYHQLSAVERRKLYFMLSNKASIQEIAATLGRHRSTIYREVKRNYHYDELEEFRGYFHLTAHEIVLERRARLKKIYRSPTLKAFVLEKLKLHWSPEQIAGYLKRTSKSLSICHETIYRYFYDKEGIELGLYHYLAKHKKKCHRRYGRKERAKRIPEHCLITHRPSHIDKREEFGHWECDLMIFNRELNHKTNISTIVERKSRYTMLIKNPNRKSFIVLGNIKHGMRSFPSNMVKSMTFDQGSEFMLYSPLKKKLGMDIYFCEPHSPWQKGTVENTNARIRRFLPRETDLLNLPDKSIGQLTNKLNHTPRKCLSYQTPYEVFHHYIQQAREFYR